MKYLAINTADKTEILLNYTIATGKDKALYEDKTLYFKGEDKVMASAELLPRISDMLDAASLTLNELDFFACVVGPGSFTGIRIGVCTVKAFCYALNKPALPLTYFDYLSYNKSPNTLVAINGAGGVCYLKNAQSPPTAIKNEDIFRHAGNNPIIVNGDFLPKSPQIEIFKSTKEAFKGAVECVFKRDKTSFYADLVPLYLRRAQAERAEGEL